MTKAAAILLEVEGLGIDFEVAGQRVRAVSDLSFHLHRGEVLALVGESGSGKTVSALALCGLLPPSARVSGSAKLVGTELLALSPRDLRRVRGSRVAFVFQDPSQALDPSFTVGYQIDEVLRRHRPEMTRAGRRVRVLELLDLVEIPEHGDRVGSYPHQLSGGQIQRVAIAMALACDPELLIADEPTTALDVTVQREVLDVMRRLRDRTGTAILLITHDMGVVADIADRVIVMRQGIVEESADVASLFRVPSAAYTRALLESVPRTGSPDRSGPEGAVTPVLEVEALSVSYGRGSRSRLAVSDVTFSVGRGEFVGLVGESGSGKSTIGRCALGLVPVSAGSARVDGVELSTARGRRALEVRRSIGVVFQNSTAALDPRLTVGDAIAEPLVVHSRSRDRDARVRELLESVELPASWRNRYPHELSGGQRQRVAIARAIALRPRLLIADEPTSALDVSVQATVLDLLLALQRELRFACLFISHDLAVIDQLCDRVVVLRGGQVVEQGPRFQVMTNPTRLYTQRLIAAAPVPDPEEQERRRLGLARA